MEARTWLLLALVAIPALGSSPALAAHRGVHVPEARVGDEGTYVQADQPGPAFGFEWLPANRTFDRWGRAHTADVLRTILRPDAKAPDPDRDWTPDGPWAEVREAFAGGPPHPLWRLDPRGWTQNGSDNVLIVPVVGLETASNTNILYTDYAPPPSFRSCFARHGLQGRSPSPGASVPLETLCPGLEPLGIRSAAHPARATSFLERSALEFTYDVHAGSLTPGDLSLPVEGVLRIVVADGLPFLARVEASAAATPGESRSFVLAGFQRGLGDVVAAGGADVAEEPPLHPQARLHPLGSDGPRDGGSGLPYRLEDALSSIRGDPSLARFQVWNRLHPEAFVRSAEYWWSYFHPPIYPRGLNRSLGQEAEWVVVFAAPGRDGAHEWIMVSSKASYDHDLPLVGTQTSRLVRNEVMVTGSDDEVVRPSGEPTLDIAAALRVFRAQLEPPFRDLPIRYLSYAAPRVETQGEGADALHLPPSLKVVGHVEMADEPASLGSLAAELDLDATAGAAKRLVTHDYWQDWGEVTLGPGTPLEARAATAPPPALANPGADIAVLTGLALLLAVLGHAGYLTVAYTRLRRLGLLDHPSRHVLYELVRTRPGLHLKGLKAAAGLSLPMTRYHLQVLEKGGLLTHVAMPGYKRYFLHGSVPHGTLAAQAVLVGRSARAIYDLTRREPGLSLSELARRLQVTPAAVHKTVERLEAVGLVVKWTRGREACVAARDPVGLN